MFWHELEKTDEELEKEDAADGVIGADVGLKGKPPVNQYNNLEDATVVIQSAKRHSIKLNDISALQNQYKSNSYFKTGELISNGKFYSVSLFANVYMPPQLDKDDVQFVLTINGIDYEAMPVNSMYNGNKIFRYSQGKSSPDYTVLLTEPIKSVLLTVKMNATKNATPLIGNIKVLLGGEI
jgi:hypothetical protein